MNQIAPTDPKRISPYCSIQQPVEDVRMLDCIKDPTVEWEALVGAMAMGHAPLSMLTYIRVEAITTMLVPSLMVYTILKHVGFARMDIHSLIPREDVLAWHSFIPAM
jgi:hypothetical protein